MTMCRLIIVAALAALCLSGFPAVANQQGVVETLTEEQQLERMDDDMREVMEKLKELDPQPIAKLTADEARRQPTPADAVKAVMADKGMSEPELDLQIEDRRIPGSEVDGPDDMIDVRVITPGGDDADAAGRPGIVYFHGGGWVIADLDVYEASMKALADQTGAVVVGVAYRQAPEFPFPTALNDAYAATRYVIENAPEFGIDPARVAVAGESAGGNLATAVCIGARDEGGRMPVHQLLVYPVTDLPSDRPSYVENADAAPLNRDMMTWFFSYYLPDERRDEALALPMQVEDLSGLPPATVITAQIDPLRDDGAEYARRLQQAGVDVAYRNFDGVVHEFFGMAPLISKATEAQEFAAERLKMAFERPE